MTTGQRAYYNDRRARVVGRLEMPWPDLHGRPENFGRYDYEEDLCDQIARFPTAEQIDELCEVLRITTLRELSAEILKGGITHTRDNTDRLEYARLLNSWLATAEETIAAGRNVNRIASRRRANE